MVLILVSVALVSIAQLLLRAAFLAEGMTVELAAGQAGLRSVLLLGCGAGAYLLSFFVWIQGLRSVPLHVAYGLLSLSYPIVYLTATGLPMFAERPHPLALLGVIFVSAGVVLIGTSDSDGD